MAKQKSLAVSVFAMRFFETLICGAGISAVLAFFSLKYRGDMMKTAWIGAVIIYIVIQYMLLRRSYIGSLSLSNYYVANFAAYGLYLVISFALFYVFNNYLHDIEPYFYFSSLSCFQYYILPSIEPIISKTALHVLFLGFVLFVPVTCLYASEDVMNVSHESGDFGIVGLDEQTPDEFFSDIQQNNIDEDDDAFESDELGPDILPLDISLIAANDIPAQDKSDNDNETENETETDNENAEQDSTADDKPVESTPAEAETEAETEAEAEEPALDVHEQDNPSYNNEEASASVPTTAEDDRSELSVEINDTPQTEKPDLQQNNSDSNDIEASIESMLQDLIKKNESQKSDNND